MYDDFSSVRFITVLTPDTFLRDMIVVSTLFRKSPDKTGETAIANATALNSVSIDFEKLKYKVVKKHKTLAEARKFHDTFAKSKKWKDTVESKPC